MMGSFCVSLTGNDVFGNLKQRITFGSSLSASASTGVHTCARICFCLYGKSAMFKHGAAAHSDSDATASQRNCKKGELSQTKKRLKKSRISHAKLVFISGRGKLRRQEIHAVDVRQPNECFV